MILLLEPTGGVAGDMFLAAALDLGVPREELIRHLSTLKVPGWKLEVTRSQRHGISGTHVDVVVEGDPHDHPQAGADTHAHSHGTEDLAHAHGSESHSHNRETADHAHGSESHSHGHDHAHGTADHDHGTETNQGHHPDGHRPLSEIRALITASQLPAAAKDRALAVFSVIGAAESKIHDIPIEQIAFHEVGAVDSIIDICGAAVVLELLGNPDVFSTPPPLGSGTIRIAHGVVPVPVPATLEILRGVPVLFEGKGELTTPTGAALLKTFARIGHLPSATVERIGYGLGTKDWPDRANVLRASIAHRTADEATAVQVIEANLDDCSPQLLGALIDTLMKQGALDAWVVPATMKKGRPGHLLSVLTSEATHRALIATVLAESTSLGVRSHRAERTVLARRFEEVPTPWGVVRIKLGLQGDIVLNAAPEFDDCRAVADAAKVPLKRVMTAAMAAWETRRPK